MTTCLRYWTSIYYLLWQYKERKAIPGLFIANCGLFERGNLICNSRNRSVCREGVIKTDQYVC